MNWQELGGISEPFFTHDRRFAFQRVDNYWRLYGWDGNFIQEFRSFVSMNEFIMKDRLSRTYQVFFIDGHDLKYKVFTCEALDEKDAISKMFDKHGRNFDHQIVNVCRMEDHHEKDHD